MKKSLLAVSIAAATGLGVSQSALADVYAYAYNNIFDLQITANPFLIPTSAVFKLDNSASLTGFAGDINTGSFSSGTAPFNILGANLGIADTNNPAAVGFTGDNYARGDASIVASELNPGAPPTVSGNLTNVWAFAESYLLDPANGAGNGIVGSTTTFDFVLEDPGTTLSFSFEALLNLIACVDDGAICGNSPAAFPSNAQASSGVSFVITNAQGVKVFDWAPGSAPTIGDGGGSENPFALTTTISRDQSNNGLAQVSLNTAGDPRFFAQTVAFAPGRYTLSLSDAKNVTTELNITAVPEPETLALMGIGLLGMFAAARRKQA